MHRLHTLAARLLSRSLPTALSFSPCPPYIAPGQPVGRRPVASESITIRFPSGAWEYAVTERVPEVGDTLVRDEDMGRRGGGGIGGRPPGDHHAPSPRGRRRSLAPEELGAMAAMGLAAELASTISRTVGTTGPPCERPGIAGPPVGGMASSSSAMALHAGHLAAGAEDREGRDVDLAASSNVSGGSCSRPSTRRTARPVTSHFVREHRPWH